MFRKSLISFIFVVAYVAVGYSAAIAQSSPVSGTVELVKADGSREPVAGALVEPYRVDIKSGFPSAKTNKKGEFAFAGIPLVGKFVFSVSAPGCAPTVFPNVKAGQEKLLISLSPGDGRKLTEDEVRKAAAAPATGGPAAGEKPAELSAEQKKAQADYEAKKAEVEEKNKKAEKTNEVVTRTVKEGNEAFTAKNYDLAIAKYTEGIDVDPEFVGSAPILLNNRSTSLTARAVDNYNKAIKLTDPTEKVAVYTSVKKDLAEAADGYLKSWNVMIKAPAEDIVDKANYEATKLGALRGAKDTYWKAVRTEQIDPSVIESAKVLVPEYLKIETDPVKKAEANVTFADLYRVVGDSDNAIAAYKKILETSPDDPDALAGAGLSLVNLGYINNDKTKLQEGANMLQKFASIAPDSNKYKADALALIETLKKEQNVTPQKVTTTKKKP
ncbi:MAG: hypothetical protein ABJB40_00605 [Acidobacteriota bacterium]